MSNEPPVDWGAQFQALAPHLDELRRRLIITVGAIIVGTLIAFFFSNRIILFLAQPIGVENLQAIGLTENLGVTVRVSLTAGAILAMPVIVYEVVAFIVPGLLPHEQRLLFISLPAIVLSFLAGVAFAYFVMLPVAVRFLANFGVVKYQGTLNDYYSFVTRVVFWIGVAFELPLVIALLARIGIVTPEQLKRSWRIAVVAIAVLAAVITPTIDPVNMAIVMGPLLALYGLSIVLATLTYRQREVATQTDEED
jgi:sec-independent protein translocase protein TatC